LGTSLRALRTEPQFNMPRKSMHLGYSGSGQSGVWEVLLDVICTLFARQSYRVPILSTNHVWANIGDDQFLGLRRRKHTKHDGILDQVSNDEYPDISPRILPIQNGWAPSSGRRLYIEKCEPFPSMWQRCFVDTDGYQRRRL
jgi:hypothetical protein